MDRSRGAVALGTSISVLVPLVFAAPVLSSTVTIHSSSTLTVNASTTSGGSDSKVRTGLDLPDPSASSRAEATYQPTAGYPEFPFYSEAHYNFGSSILRTDFNHRVVTSYPEFAGEDTSYAETLGEVMFTVGPLGSEAKISGLYTPPAIRTGTPGDNAAADTFEAEFFVTIYNVLDPGTPLFTFDRFLNGNSFTSLLTFEVGETYVYSYTALSKIVDGENTYYDASGWLQLEFLVAAGPTPIPLPSAGLGGLGLLGLAGLRRRGRGA